MGQRFAVDCTMYRRMMAGMGSYMLNLCEGLAEVAGDDEITVFVQGSELATFERFRPALRIVPVPLRGVVHRIFWQNSLLPFRSLRYDAVCFPSSYAPFLRLRPSVVVIADVQYLSFPQYWSAPRRLYRSLFTGPTVRGATVLVGMSQFTAHELERFFGRPARVIPSPVVVGRAREAPAEQPSESPYFLVLSSLSPHKNLSALVAALSAWPEDDPLPRVVFVGPYTSEVFPLVPDPSRVEVRGFVSMEERDRLVRGAAAVVVPSIFEGFGLPYVEAALLGTPVIASDIPPARELLGDKALYIHAPYGVAQIQDALRRSAQGIPRLSPQEQQALRYRTAPATVGRQIIAALREAASTT